MGARHKKLNTLAKIIWPSLAVLSVLVVIFRRPLVASLEPIIKHLPRCTPEFELKYLKVGEEPAPAYLNCTTINQAEQIAPLILLVVFAMFFIGGIYLIVTWIMRRFP